MSAFIHTERHPTSGPVIRLRLTRYLSLCLVPPSCGGADGEPIPFPFRGKPGLGVVTHCNALSFLG
jgi:hypothetical protein